MTGSDPFVAEIGIAAFNFAPRGWAMCNGQLMSISQNTALFSLLGVTYGGDGRTTFGLPNLQGRLVPDAGQGTGLSSYGPGQTGGVEQITLDATTTMPAHTHGGQASGQAASLTQPATTQAGADNSPENNVPANPGRGAMYAPTSNASMAPYALTLQAVGSSQPVSIMQAGLVLTYCISLQGVFPPRP